MTIDAEVNNISKQLIKIINREKSMEAAKDNEWKEKYDWLCTELKQMREDADTLRNDMRDNALTFSAIEAEGFLRCAISMVAQIERINSSYNLSDE